MIWRETELAGAFVVESEPIEDERGWFARIYDESEFAERGLAARFVQGSAAFNTESGTLRGMHYQEEPHAEAKLVRCVRGRRPRRDRRPAARLRRPSSAGSPSS